MVGQNVRKYPDIVRRVENEGHTIGNHTDTHPKLPTLDRAGIEREVDTCESALELTLGHRVSFFRPPYGASNTTVREVLFDRKFSTLVTWNVDSEDWKSKDRKLIVPKVLADCQAQGHGIVLMHDIHAESVASVQAIIDGLRAKGFALVRTVEALDAAADPPRTTLVAGSVGVVDTSVVLATPSATGAVVVKMKAGQRVKVLNVLEPWLEVETAGGVFGYIASQSASELPPGHTSMNLQRGVSGPRVAALQRALNAAGATLVADGDFGPGTESALKTYQSRAGLPPDGVAGPMTLRSLGLPPTL